MHPHVTDAAISITERDALERGFRRLDPEQRSLVVLYYYQGLPLEEVATALRIPAGTAKSRLFRAREALRAALEADARTVTAGGVA
jgi:RNA polymerase sigma-70 factor, ECF subfamily